MWVGPGIVKTVANLQHTIIKDKVKSSFYLFTVRTRISFVLVIMYIIKCTFITAIKYSLIIHGA